MEINTRREKSNQYRRKWYSRNKEKERARCRKWYSKNKDYKPKWRIENKEKEIEYYAKSKERYPEKYHAHGVIKAAITNNKMFRSPVCQNCGEWCFAHAHHPDYSKPKEVEWLCAECHGVRHRL